MQDFTLFISHHSLLVAAAIVIFCLLLVVELLKAKQQTYNLKPTDVTQLINKQNAVVIDIRKKESYYLGHIIAAHSVQAEEIIKNPKKLEKFKNRPIILVSQVQAESQKIAVLLLKQGFQAYSLSGGMKAWIEAQMPLVKD